MARALATKIGSLAGIDISPPSRIMALFRTPIPIRSTAGLVIQNEEPVDAPQWDQRTLSLPVPVEECKEENKAHAYNTMERIWSEVNSDADGDVLDAESRGSDSDDNGNPTSPEGHAAADFCM